MLGKESDELRTVISFYTCTVLGVLQDRHNISEKLMSVLVPNITRGKSRQQSTVVRNQKWASASKGYFSASWILKSLSLASASCSLLRPSCRYTMSVTLQPIILVANCNYTYIKCVLLIWPGFGFVFITKALSSIKLKRLKALTSNIKKALASVSRHPGSSSYVVKIW